MVLQQPSYCHCSQHIQTALGSFHLLTEHISNAIRTSKFAAMEKRPLTANRVSQYVQEFLFIFLPSLRVLD